MDKSNKTVRGMMKDAVLEGAKISATTVAESTAKTAAASAKLTSDVVSTTAHSAADLTGMTLDTVNRYTKDFVDVGSFGNQDLSGDMGSLIAGTAAMTAVNAARMGKSVLQPAQIRAANTLYSDRRLEKAAKNAAPHAANTAIEDPYWSIASGRKRNTNTRGFDPRTRYAKLAQSKRLSTMKDKFLAGRPERMAKRKQMLIDSVENYKTFSAKDSLKGTLSNQSRKLVSLTLNGNDPSGLTNKVFADTFSTARHLSRAGKELSRAAKAGAKAARLAAGIARHPIQLIKNGWAVVSNLVSAITTAITSLLAGIVSLFLAMLPLIVSLLAILAVVAAVVSVVSFFVSVLSPPRSSVSGGWQEVELCDRGNSIKDIAWASQAWNPSSDQAKIWNCDQERGYACFAGTPPPEGDTAFGHLSKDPVHGFYYYEIDGIKYYTNAVASHYSSRIGDRFRVTTDTGNVFHIIVADQKADIHTRAGNVGNSTHCVSGDGSMLEFYMDPNLARSSGVTTMNHDFGDGKNFAGAVVKMEKWVPDGIANMNALGAPDFSNTDAWRGRGDGGLNPYFPGLYGQCTWGAWGKFYEIYGYDPGFSGHGRFCAADLVASHPDKFELTSRDPKPGSIYSGIGKNHVGVILDVKPDGTLTVFDANLDDISNPWEVAVTDWVIWDKTQADLVRIYGGVVYAVPK